MTGRISRTEVDGVPVYWTDAPAKPFAAIQFRVGRADETFLQAGSTHLVEHLAFHQLGERRFPVNGFVDHVQTNFHVAGRSDENAAFLGEVAEAVSSLDVGRLDQELRVLRVEAARRAPNIPSALMTYRYGAATLGRESFSEHVLHRADPDGVRAWARDWFTRGNAVAWMTSPPPAGFQLRLPDGPRRAPGPRTPIEPLPLPSFAPVDVGGVAIGGPIARTTAGAAGTRILRSRMERKLRRDLGLSYEISEAYLPLDGAEAHVSLYASCQDDQSSRVAEEIIRLVKGLYTDGPTDEELAEDLDGFIRAHDDPDEIMGELARAAMNDLLDHPQDTAEELLEELRQLTAADVAAAMGTFAAGLIGLGAKRPILSGGWASYPLWSTGAVGGGRRLDSVAKRFPWTKGTPVLELAGEGVSVVNAAGEAITVRFDACAGVIRQEPAVRVLFGNDGFRLAVSAADWKDGAAVIAAIDRAIPPDAQVTWIDA